MTSLRQASHAGGAQPNPTGSTEEGADPVGPESGVSLREWVGMKLDSFHGSGAPIQTADWLSYLEDKMEAFEVLAQDHVRYGAHLLKGEAQIWWKGV